SDRNDSRVLPPQTAPTIGDRLDAKSVSWAWYSTGYKTTLAQAMGARKFELIAKDSNTQYQFHHHPFNYYQKLDPVNAAAYRTAHLKDYTDLLSDARAGTLPSVVFYKPMGEVNQHAGYASIVEGDAHIAQLVATLQASPQYSKMVILITYDEN